MRDSPHLERMATQDSWVKRSLGPHMFASWLCLFFLMLEHVGTCWNMLEQADHRTLGLGPGRKAAERAHNVPTQHRQSWRKGPQKCAGFRWDGKERTCYRNSMLPIGHDLKWGCEGIDQSLVEATMAVSNYLN